MFKKDYSGLYRYLEAVRSFRLLLRLHRTPLRSFPHHTPTEASLWKTKKIFKKGEKYQPRSFVRRPSDSLGTSGSSSSTACSSSGTTSTTPWSNSKCVFDPFRFRRTCTSTHVAHLEKTIRSRSDLLNLNFAEIR